MSGLDNNRKMYGIIILAVAIVALIVAAFVISRGSDGTRAAAPAATIPTTATNAARTTTQASTVNTSTSTDPVQVAGADGVADNTSNSTDTPAAAPAPGPAGGLKIMSFGCSAPGCKPSPLPYPSAPRPHAGDEILYLAELSGEATSVTVRVVDLDTSAVVSVSPMISHGLITGGPYEGNYDWQLDTVLPAAGNYLVSVTAVASDGTTVTNPDLGSMEFEVV